MLYSVAENTPLSKLPEFSDDFYALIKHLEYHGTPDASDEIFKGTAGQKLELTRWLEGSRDRQRNPLNVYLLNVGNEDEVEALEEDNEVMFKMFVRCSNYNRRAHWLSEKDPKLMRLAAMYYLEQEKFLKSLFRVLTPQRAAIYMTDANFTNSGALRVLKLLRRENTPGIFNIPHGRLRHYRVAKALYNWRNGEYNPLLYSPS